MVLTMMMLAAIGRCASPALCPTDEELVSAVLARDGAVIQAASDQAARDNPDDVILMHMERIKGISDVVCGGELPTDEPAGPPVINCKFTVRYWSTNAYYVATLMRVEGQWQISDALVVTRDRH